MPSEVNLEVKKGALQSKTFLFDERTSCVIGRSSDCMPRIPNDQFHRTISRHHCLLDINPPDIRVRDFGSLNGTYVNGKKIGQREKGMSPAEGQKMKFPEYDLMDGDEIRVGETVFGITTVVVSYCHDCTCEIPASLKETSERSPGVFVCDNCWNQRKQSGNEQDLTKETNRCARCGRDVAVKAGEQLVGHYICSRCRRSPLRIVKRLLGIANSGHKDLLGIRGYEVERELGRGGMGAVFLARRSKTGEQVALKIMLPEVAAKESSKERFLREVENAVALKHKNIAEAWESGYHNGVFYLTMEYCEAGSVADLMRKRGGTLSPDLAVNITLQTLAGLEYAHLAPIPNVRLKDGTYADGIGLVHRDIKPGNIFLAGSGTSISAKLGDFGLAKAFDLAGLSGLTLTGSKAGSPGFMPRQQAVNFKFAKPEVDVWATAASLYFMLTDRVPRDFVEDRDVFQVILETNAVPIRSRNAAVPPKLAEVIDAALVDKPTIAFKNADEFAKALDSCF